VGAELDSIAAVITAARAFSGRRHGGWKRCRILIMECCATAQPAECFGVLAEPSLSHSDRTAVWVDVLRQRALKMPRGGGRVDIAQPAAGSRGGPGSAGAGGCSATSAEKKLEIAMVLKALDSEFWQRLKVGGGTSREARPIGSGSPCWRRRRKSHRTSRWRSSKTRSSSVFPCCRGPCGCG